MTRALLAGLLMVAALAMPAGAQAPGNRGVHVENHQLRPSATHLNAISTWIPPEPIVQDYEPDPALWLLRDEDTQIYLLGTVHALPQGFRWRSARLDGLVAAADELVTESRSDESGDEESALMTQLFESFDARPLVSERLSPENGAKWLALGEAAGFPADKFDRMPPVLAMFWLGSSFTREMTGARGQWGVETVLESEFQAAGKPIRALESGTEVMTSLLALDEALLLQELDENLSQWDQADANFILATEGDADATDLAASPMATEHNWAQGKPLGVGDDLFGDTPFGRLMERVLLDDRNRSWAGWLDERLDTPGTVLVAVGAAHLEGDASVQAMLAERGLSTERLN